MRQPGTKSGPAPAPQQGTPLNLTLSSPDAINIPNTIRVYMNYRQSDQRGVIYPVPTTLNNSPGGTTGNTAGNEGLQDIVLDEARGLLYITNSGYNRIEVFDTEKQHFVTPIPAGQMPHQMAMGSDGNTLYVGNTGGESISIIDLNLQRVVDSVVFPPVQRNSTAAPIYPRSLAMGNFGLQFLMSNGTQWKVVGNQALPRPADPNLIVPVTLTGCPNCGMIATPDKRIHPDAFGQRDGLRLRCDGGRIRDHPAADSGSDSGLLRRAGRGAGRRVLPGERADCQPVVDDHRRFGVTRSDGRHGRRRRPGGGPPVVSIINTGNRNVAALAPLGATRFLRLTTPVRQNITTVTKDDSRTTLEMVNLQTGSDTLAGRGAGESGGQRFRHHAVQYQSAHDDGEFGGDHGVHDHALGIERGVADADRNGYAAHDQYGRNRHRQLVGRHAELRAGLVHHDLRQEPGGCGDSGFDSAADRSGWFVRDLRRYRGAAAGDVQRTDSGTDTGHAVAGHASGGGALAQYGSGLGPGSDHGEAERKLGTQDAGFVGVIG